MIDLYFCFNLVSRKILSKCILIIVRNFDAKADCARDMCSN